MSDEINVNGLPLNKKLEAMRFTEQDAKRAILLQGMADEAKELKAQLDEERQKNAEGALGCKELVATVKELRTRLDNSIELTPEQMKAIKEAGDE